MIYKVFAILPGESVLAGCAEEGIVALLTYRIEDGQYFLHCFEDFAVGNMGSKVWE